MNIIIFIIGLIVVLVSSIFGVTFVAFYIGYWGLILIEWIKEKISGLKNKHNKK